MPIIKKAFDRVPQFGLVILAGGKSSRFGSDKVLLKLRGRTFLETIISQFQPLDVPIVVAGKRPLDFSDPMASVVFAADEKPDYGPLEGIRVGLSLLEPTVEFAFVTSCDAPLIRSEVACFLLNRIDSFQSAVPRSESNAYGMTAIYRTDIHPIIETRIVNGQLRVRDLAEVLRTRFVDLEELRLVDPNLDSFVNVNTPEDYRLLLERPE